MKCRSEKHLYPAEGGGAGPVAMQRCLDGWWQDWDGAEGVCGRYRVRDQS